MTLSPNRGLAPPGSRTANRYGVEVPEVDVYGTPVVLEEFGNVIAEDGSGVVFASQSGHRLGVLTAQECAPLATTPADELLQLPMLERDHVTDPFHAYQPAKAWQLSASHCRSRSMGPAGCLRKHDQRRHHLHSAPQRRAERPAR
jgi:hypothetical protein